MYIQVHENVLRTSAPAERVEDARETEQCSQIFFTICRLFGFYTITMRTHCMCPGNSRDDATVHTNILFIWAPDNNESKSGQKAICNAFVEPKEIIYMYNI